MGWVVWLFLIGFGFMVVFVVLYVGSYFGGIFGLIVMVFL